MRLLVIAFAVDLDHPALAWQAKAAALLAARCERLVVVAESVGRHALPANAEVIAMPRWLLPGTLRPLGIRRLALPWLRRRLAGQRIDAVFIHMAQEWAWRLHPLFRERGMPSLLWYAHGSVHASLQRALDSVDRVVTSTAEGFRIASPKVRVIGQGIDSDLFALVQPEAASDIVYIGRIARRKRIDRLLAVLAQLSARGLQPAPRLRLIGPTLTADDEAYAAEMRQLAQRLGLDTAVEWAGAMPQERLPQAYRTAFLHLNLSETGSMDKTVLEALSCGCPVLTTNEAFAGALTGTGMHLPAASDDAAVAAAVAARHAAPPDAAGRGALRALVAGRHDQQAWVGRVADELQDLIRKAQEAS